MTARVLERLEEALTASAHTNVLSQSPPARDGAAKITIVEDGLVPRHCTRMTARNVTKLLVAIQTALPPPLAHVVDLSHETALSL